MNESLYFVMNKSLTFQKYIDNTKRCFYLSNSIVSKLKIKKYDKVAVIIKKKNSFIFPAIIGSYITNSGRTFSVNIPNEIRRQLQKEEYKIKIIKLDKINTTKKDNNTINIVDITKIYKTMTATNWIYKNQIVLWNKGEKDRNYFPIITKDKIKIKEELLIYLGLYFADGTKSEKAAYNLSVSTKEMFNLTVNNYKLLIKNSSLNYGIQYDNSNANKLKKEEIFDKVTKYWKKILSKNKIKRVNIKTSRPNASYVSNNHNEFGGLRFWDGRKIVLWLHKWLINKIIHSDNKKYLLQFLKGGFLGDGYPSMRPRSKAFNWLEIASNKQESWVWKKVCNSLDIKFIAVPKKKDNGEILKIHGYLNAVNLLNAGLFKQYEKRRKRLINGLSNRIETYLFNLFLMHNKKEINLTIRDIKKTSSYIYPKKGAELASKNLIEFNKENLKLTNKGETFLNLLLDNKIVNL